MSSEIIALKDYESPSATVVSMLPMGISETKTGLIPAVFDLDKPAEGDFSILVVKKTVAPIRTGNEYKGNPVTIIVPQSCHDIARSIVEDYVTAQPFIKRFEEEPALFWVKGEWTKEEIKANFFFELEEAERKQTAWFITLCRIADDHWARHQRNAAISDVQRYAANKLGHKAPWTTLSSQITFVNCPSCNIQVSKQQIRCHACKYILDKKRYRKEDYAE